MRQTTYTSLDDVIRYYIELVGDTEQRSYVKFLRIIREVLSEFGYSIIPNYSSKKYKIGEDLSVPMTDEMVSVSKVGALNAEGIPCFLEPLNYKFSTDVDCGCEGCTGSVAVKDSNCWRSTFYNYTNNQYFGEMYGLSASYDYGKYHVNYDSRKIEFVSGGSEIFKGNIVVVEFETSDKNNNLVPDVIKEMVRHRVFTIFYESSNINKSRYHNREFRRHLNNFKIRHQRKFTPEMLINAMRGNPEI
jgi:hypothetical protein